MSLTVITVIPSSSLFSNQSFEFIDGIDGFSISKGSLQQILEIIGEKERISPALLVLMKNNVLITSVDDLFPEIDEESKPTTMTIQIEIVAFESNMKKVDEFFNDTVPSCHLPVSLLGCCVACGEKIKQCQPLPETQNNKEDNKKTPASPVSGKKAPVATAIVVPGLSDQEAHAVIQLPCGHFIHKNRNECMFKNKRNANDENTHHEDENKSRIRCSYCLSRWTYKWKRHHQEENLPPPIPQIKKPLPNNNTNNKTNNNSATPQVQSPQENYEFAPWMMSSAQEKVQKNNNVVPKSLQRFFNLQKCQLEGVNCQNQAVAVCDVHKSSSGGPALCDVHMKERHGYPECRRVELSTMTRNNFSMFFLPCPIESHRKNERRHFELNRRMLVCSICQEEDDELTKNANNIVKVSDPKVKEIADQVLRSRMESSTSFLSNLVFPSLKECTDFYQNVKINQKKQLTRLELYSKKVNDEIDRQYSCTKEILERQLRKLETEYQNRKNEAKEQFETTKKHLEKSDKLSEPLEKILRQGSEILNQVSERMTTIQIAHGVHPCLVAAKNVFAIADDAGEVQPRFPSDFSSSAAFPKSKIDDDDDDKHETTIPRSFFLNQFISAPVPQLFGFSSFVDRNFPQRPSENEKVEEEANINLENSSAMTSVEIANYLEKYGLKPVQEETQNNVDDDERELCRKISEADWVLQNFQHEGCYLERELYFSSSSSLFSSTIPPSLLLTCNKLGNIMEPTQRKEFKMKFSLEEMRKIMDEKCWGDLSDCSTNEGVENQTKADEDVQVESNELKATVSQGECAQENDEGLSEQEITDSSGETEENPIAERKVVDETTQEISPITQQENRNDRSNSSSKNTEPNLYPPQSLIIMTKNSGTENLSSPNKEKILHPERMPPPHPSFFAGTEREPNENSNDDVHLLQSQLMTLVSEEKECLRRLRCWVVGWHVGETGFHAQVFYDVASAREWYNSSLSNNKRSTATRVIVSVETLQLIEEYFVDRDLRGAVLQFAEKKAEAVRSNVSLQLQLIRKKLAEFDV